MIIFPEHNFNETNPDIRRIETNIFRHTVYDFIEIAITSNKSQVIKCGNTAIAS